MAGRGPAAPDHLARVRAGLEATAARLDAFRPDSAVSCLNLEGRVQDPHVARVVGRALEYASRTRGAFDVTRGEHAATVKRFIAEGGPHPEPLSTRTHPARVSVEGDVVTTDSPVDLNGLAKGYLVDVAFHGLKAAGLTEVLVDGGGDIASPPGPVGIERPDGRGFLAVLETEWNVATSASHRRRRGRQSHLYDPRAGAPVPIDRQTTVLAERDVMEADALATALTVLPLDEALALARSWPRLEALFVRGSEIVATEGFRRHVHAP